MPRILVIEDDTDVRLVFENVLVDDGYEVDTVETVRAGCERLEHQTYDLVISDGRLPDGIGTTLADMARGKGIPAMIITGYALWLDEKAGVDLSNYNVLSKPVRPGQLLQAVARTLGACSNERAFGHDKGTRGRGQASARALDTP